MPDIKIIRYTTSSQNADPNEQLVRNVFAELDTNRPDGLRYATFRLDDGISFLHLAVLDADENPLNASPAFAAFQLGIAERCTAGPTAADAVLIGSYRLLPDLTQQTGRPT
jgi:hypothetical protein